MTTSLFSVRMNGRFGYVNKSGDIVVDIRYDNATAFSDDVAAVHAGDLGKDGVSYLINKRGRIIFESRGS